MLKALESRESISMALPNSSWSPMRDLPLSARSQRIALALIVLLCVLLRLWSLGSPPLDRSYWKEIDYIQISQSYWEDGYRFAHPQIRWPAEDPRVTAMELPLVPYLAALVYPFGGINAFSVRMVPLLSWLLVVLLVHRLGKLEGGPLVGLLAAFVAAVLPMFHTHRNVLFSEPTMIACSVLTVHAMARWREGGRRKHWCLAVAAFSLAVATKLTPLYLLLPVLVAIWGRERGWLSSARRMALFILPALVLPVAWYAWAYHLSQSSIDVFGIFGGHDKMQSATMLRDPAWYSALMEQVVWRILGGKVALALAIVGVAALFFQRRALLVLAYLASVLVYFAMVAEGQIDAPYRQLTLVPAISICVAMGAAKLAALAVAAIHGILPAARGARWTNLLSAAMALVLVLLIPARNSAFLLHRDLEDPIHDEEWELARVLDPLTDADSRLVTLGEYTIHVGGNDLSPVLYHYSGLRGWSLQRDQWGLDQVDDLVSRGATHLVARQMEREPDSAPFLEALRARYLLAAEGEGWMILQLSAPDPPSSR